MRPASISTECIFNELSLGVEIQVMVNIWAIMGLTWTYVTGQLLLSSKKKLFCLNNNNFKVFAIFQKLITHISYH